MKKLFLAGALMAMMVVAVFTAGCTTNPTTTAPTATPSASTTTAASDQTIIQYLDTTMQQLNFSMMTPFSLQPRPQVGLAVYNGTVRDANGTYAVSVQACNNASTARAHYLAVQNGFMGQGYTTLLQNATMWSGYNNNTQRGASASYGTSSLMPYYCMVITGNTTGPVSFQQAAWLYMWNHMNGYYVNGYGMGSHMGYGVNPSTRSQMQQVMQQHMGSVFG